MKKMLVILLTFTSISVSAADNGKDGFNILLSLGLTSGGDTLAELNTGGKLKSGGLIYLALGTVYQFPESPYQIQPSFGYHFDTLDSDNGSADFDRTFIEVIPFYKITETTRLGLGITNILSADYSEPGFDLEFDKPLGIIAEINWRLSGGSWWGLRYVDMEYTVESANGFNIAEADITIDGSYFGIMLNGVF